MAGFTAEDHGLALAIVGTGISILGVFFNNVLLRHTTAMVIWVVSNSIFVIYFHGRTCKWWDGGLGDKLLRANYIAMLVSGVYGLWLA